MIPPRTGVEVYRVRSLRRGAQAMDTSEHDIFMLRAYCFRYVQLLAANKDRL